MHFDLGEIFFSVIITYMGAVELAFLAQNLVHWIFRHRAANNVESVESLEDLQKRVENKIKEAESMEVPGFSTMKDGVLYKDGFRVDADLLANRTFRPDFVNDLRKTLGIDDRNEIERELIGASNERIDMDNESEKRGEVQEEPCIKKVVNRSSVSPAPAENLISNNEPDEYHERTEMSQETSHTQQSHTEELNDSLSSSHIASSPTESGQIASSPTQSVQIASSLTESGQIASSPTEPVQIASSLTESGQIASSPTESGQIASSLTESRQIASSPTEPSQVPELTFDEYQREEPDGQDCPGLKYSEEYLRSLDGIKHRPLVREDGTGRRRAFRKRLSIDSTSSRESRASREEELKMFTSLEEEEFEAIRKGETDYVPIRYTSEPSLQVKKHHRRHRKSPIKDSNRRFTDDDSRSSTEKYDEEEVNPWGDIVPEPYKNTEFWRREKAISIEEEDADVTAGRELPKASSFEEATDTQNEKALDTLKQMESNKHENEREKSPCDTRKSVEKNVSKDDVADTLADGYPNAYDQPASPDTLKTPLKSDVYIEISNDLEVNLEADPLEMEEHFSSELQLPPERLSPRPSTVTVEVESEDLMEGISDFYDFNASINPSRSRSRSMSREKSLTRSKSKSPFRPASSNSMRSVERFPIVPLDAKGVEGLSDFYDYCVLLNRRCYGHSANRNTTQCSENSSIDLLLRDHDLNQPHKEDKTPVSHSKNGVIQEEDTGGTLDLKSSDTETHPKATTPTTPGSDISFVSVPSYVEKMKEEYRSHAFVRSQYPGESMDLSDSFENLREEARHFRRSRSRSRSLEGETKKLSGQELQAKILEEITRTTIDYQDFSKNINQTFIDRERRGSDSALLHKPEILIQIQDERENSYSEDDDAIMDILEADEYHHFRRFSLNQDYQVEEYPIDNYVYVEKVEVRTKGGIRHWIREDFYDGDQQKPKVMPLTSIESNDESDRAEAEDLESGSDDERQTVVEVEDDILDNIKSDTLNDDFPEEETKLFIEKYQWKDDESPGENSEEDTYDENLGSLQGEETPLESSDVNKNYSSNVDIPIRPATIQKTFRIDRSTDGLPKTLREAVHDHREELHEREESARWGLKTSRSPSKELSAALIENERNLEAYIAASSSATSSTKSKRLRTRYGIGTASSSYLSYDVGDNYTPETVQPKPKKEYNWRKNFRIDDDDEPPKSDKKLAFSTETKTEEDPDPAKEGAAEDLLDPRKMSLGGESITLYTRSPDRIKDFDFSGDNFEREFDELGEEGATNVDEEFQNMFERQAIELEENEGVPKVLNERLTRSIADEEVEINIRVGDVGGFLKETQQEAIANLAMEQDVSVESTKKSKKKKGKKKAASVEDEAPEVADKDETAGLSKKKNKKKRRSAEKDEVTPQKSPSPPSKKGSEIKQTYSAPEKMPPNSHNKPTAPVSSSIVPEPTPRSQPQKDTSPSPSSKREAEIQQTHSALERRPPQNKPTASASSSVVPEATPRSQPQKDTSPSPSSKREAEIQQTHSALERRPPQNKPTASASSSVVPEATPTDHPQKATSPLPRSEFNPSNSPKKKIERQQSSGAYELIKDGSMYPWF